MTKKIKRLDFNPLTVRAMKGFYLCGSPQVSMGSTNLDDANDAMKRRPHPIGH